LRIVDQEVVRAPQDMDLRAWRARVLAWSGHLADAEREYLEILQVSRNDPYPKGTRNDPIHFRGLYR